MKKTIALLFFVFLFGGLIIYRWHEKETAGSGAPAPEVLPVETVFLKKLTFEDKVSFAAGIEPEELLAHVHPARVGNTQGSGMGGMASIQRLYRDAVLGGT